MEEPIDPDILLLLFTLLPFLSRHVYHVPTFNDRPEHVSHVFECAGIHAGVCVCVGVCVHVCVWSMCVCSIDQVSAVDVERARQDKLDDAILTHAPVSFWLFLSSFSEPVCQSLSFQTSCSVAHIILI